MFRRTPEIMEAFPALWADTTMRIRDIARHLRCSVCTVRALQKALTLPNQEPASPHRAPWVVALREDTRRQTQARLMAFRQARIAERGRSK